MLSGNETNVQIDLQNQRRGITTTRALNDILKELVDLYWVVSASVIRRDGILMASVSNQPQSNESKNACALITATIMGAAKNITTKCRIGFPHYIIIQAKEGDVVISEAGSKAILVVMTNERYHPALMEDEISRVALAVSTMV